MIAKALTRAEASALYEALLTGTDYEPTIDEVGQDGTREDFQTALEEYRRVVSDLLEEFADRSDPSALNEMDALAAERIHTALPLSDGIAADDGFWRYMALYETWNLLKWRHGRDESGSIKVAADHVGLGGKWECFPKRLWFRAELSVQPAAADPYSLSRRGGADFWKSGVMWQAYSAARPVVRALVSYQYPENGQFQGTAYRPQTLTFTGIRELYKRLRHFQAFLSFGALDDAGATELVNSLAQDLPRIRNRRAVAGGADE